MSGESAVIVDMSGGRKDPAIDEMLKAEKNVVEGKYHPATIRGLVESVMEVGQWASPVDAPQMMAIPVVVKFADREGRVFEAFEEYVEELVNFFTDNGEQMVGGVYTQGLVDLMQLDSANGEVHKEAIKGRALAKAKEEVMKQAETALCYRRGQASSVERGEPGGKSAELRLHQAARASTREDRVETIQGVQVPAAAPKWQKCPVCEGSGIDPSDMERIKELREKEPEVGHIATNCSVCSGKKIIGVDTGLPPGA